MIFLKPCQQDDNHYFFCDVMTRGYYPNYSEEIFKEKKVVIKKEVGDDEILKQYTLDYITFSYYRSTTVSQNTKIDIMGGGS